MLEGPKLLVILDKADREVQRECCPYPFQTLGFLAIPPFALAVTLQLPVRGP